MGPQGGGSKSAGALRDLRILGPKTAIFHPQNVPKPNQSAKTMENRCHVPWPACFARANELFGDLQLHVMSEKRPKNALKWPKICTVQVNQSQNQEWAIFWARWLKNGFREHLFHPQCPTFCGVHP